LAAEVAARFRVPQGGGRATDPSWSEQRLVRAASTARLSFPPCSSRGVFPLFRRSLCHFL